MHDRVSRRAMVAGGLAAAQAVRAASGKPPVLGGEPLLRAGVFPSWPMFDEREEKALLEVLRSGHWGRNSGKQVDRFESAYARLTGAKGCVATVNGTNALYAALNVVGVEPGDEVLVAPFTFVATVNVILRQHALPVFVDSDVDTFQVDPRKMEPLVNGRTKAILPVHIGGYPADMDGIMAVAQKRGLAVVEDACQAWVAEWRGRNVGRWGNCGCFSFQASKNLNSGEGGAVISDDEDLIERCYSFHTQGRVRRRKQASLPYPAGATNLRISEFQAAVLLAQLTRFEEHAKRRSENAAYLTSLLREIPGIHPARMYDGCTRNAYHLYMFRYDKREFAGLPRDKFLKALNADGIPFKAGYGPLNKAPFIQAALESRGFRALFSAQRLARWREENQLPGNDRLCQEACWGSQWSLLADRSTMEQMAEGVVRVRKHAAELARA